jgi:hypothetical protein
MTHSHLASIEVGEEIDAEQPDWHPPAACGAMLAPRRFVVTHKHLRAPAAAT